MTVRTFAALALVLACTASTARAQGGASRAKECVVVSKGVVVNGVVTTHSDMHGKDTTWVGGGFDAKCEGTDQRVLSDSAEHYADRHLMILIGHVHYTESRLKLDADRITYFTVYRIKRKANGLSDCSWRLAAIQVPTVVRNGKRI